MQQKLKNMTEGDVDAFSSAEGLRWLLRVASAVPLALFWWYSLSTPQKVQSVLTSGAFSVEELLFTGVTDGVVALPPARRTSSVHVLNAVRETARTTWAMFLVNMAYYRLGIVWWFSNPSFFWRQFLFPLNVWFCEIVFGCYLLFVWRIRAWDYSHASWGAVFGTIRLDYAPVWWLLGLVHELLQISLYTPFTDVFCRVFGIAQ